MTKKERKAKMREEASRLNKAIPRMFIEFAEWIAYHNIDYPENQIPDEFLLRLVEQGEKMEVFGKDADAASNLRTRNSETNYKSLRKLMGEELFREMNQYGMNYGYVATLYDSIARSGYGF